MSGEVLAQEIREAIGEIRKGGQIPTQLRLNQNAWNTIREHLKFRPYARREEVQFEGVPCVLAVGLQQSYRIKSIGMQTLEAPKPPSPQPSGEGGGDGANH